MKINISKRTVKILFAFACLYFIWGSTYMAIKFAIDSMPPFLMASSRFLAAGLILFGISRVKSDEKIEYKHWKSAFITGGLLLLGGNGGVVYAELYLPSGITALLISAVPIWFVILNWLLPKGEKPTVRTIIGVLVGFSGMYYLIHPRWECHRQDYCDNSHCYYGPKMMMPMEVLPRQRSRCRRVFVLSDLCKRLPQ